MQLLHIEGVHGTHGIAAAQQETVALASVLTARQAAHGEHVRALEETRAALAADRARMDAALQSQASEAQRREAESWQRLQQQQQLQHSESIAASRALTDAALGMHLSLSDPPLLHLSSLD